MDGAFEVAYNDDETFDEINISDEDEKPVLGNLVDKGLQSSISSAPKKLQVKPAPTTRIRKNKITMISSNKANTKQIAKSTKYQKVIVVRNNKKQQSKSIAQYKKTKPPKVKLVSQKHALKNPKVTT